MNKLDMIKAYAKLEGVEVLFRKGVFYKQIKIKDSSIITNCTKLVPYNPITDLALTMKAVFDYNVEITHAISEEQQEHFISVSINSSFHTWADSPKLAPLSIIECILKSEGLWV